MVLYKTFYDHQQSIFPVSHVLDGAHSSHGASFYLIQFNFIYTASITYREQPNNQMTHYGQALW